MISVKRLAMGIVGLFISSQAFAAGEFRMWPVMLETRFATGETQDVESQNVMGLSAGYSYKGWAGMLEYSQFDQKTGTVFSEVSRKHEEIVAWLEPNITNWGSLVVYGAGGAGYAQESIDSRLSNQVVSTNSIGEMIYGAGAGVRLRMDKHILFKFSTRAMFGDSMQPNPNLSYQIGLGFGI